MTPYLESKTRVLGFTGIRKSESYFFETALDSSLLESRLPRDEGNPPECDAIPNALVREKPWDAPSCINRHNGYVNGLFFDWSVRRVGLKELWTLKWHRKFNVAGPWTKAGGARPEDWPEWMRGFKDY